MNDFCMECVGYDKEEVKKCDDVCCPFHTERWANLPYQDNKNAKP